eukprot:CAMPEP_0173298086 /NCGR_PEP_ID=MMETSP1143-20121109/15896_1 /TAXON_ID=483371 /ORGANISM="non described non described, Strain CCMP2298" /LENGTH=194 /DNA_ID=CAMNT_0014238161 /DNA_START=60 /DNA_END=641 /DNA_ORIENTATION=-
MIVLVHPDGVTPDRKGVEKLFDRLGLSVHDSIPLSRFLQGAGQTLSHGARAAVSFCISHKVLVGVGAVVILSGGCVYVWGWHGVLLAVPFLSNPLCSLLGVGVAVGGAVLATRRYYAQWRMQVHRRLQLLTLRDEVQDRMNRDPSMRPYLCPITHSVCTAPVSLGGAYYEHSAILLLFEDTAADGFVPVVPHAQ